MADEDGKLTRREFNLAAFSAGLAALTTPSWVVAQEQQAQQESAPPRKKKKAMAQQKVESTPMMHHADYSSLRLSAQVECHDTHFDLALYLSNTSDRPISVPHTMGGIPDAIPTGTIVIADKAFAIEPRIPREALERVTRAATVDYLEVAPTGESGIATFFASYKSAWPGEILKAQKGYVGKLAKLDLELTLHHMGPMPRTGKTSSKLVATSDRFELPTRFEKMG